MDDLIKTLLRIQQYPSPGEADEAHPGRTRNRQSPRPPTSEAMLMAVEERLRLPLPPLLRRIYREVSNGGVGPGIGGIYRVPENASEIEFTLLDEFDDSPPQEIWPGFFASVFDDTDNTGEYWIQPTGLVKIANGGCQTGYYIYALHPDFPILRMDEPTSLPEKPWTFTTPLEMLHHFGDIEALSFDAWIEEWTRKFALPE